MMVADWKFDGKVVPVFDEHVRKSVPMYDEIHRLVVDLSAWFIEDRTNVYDIGTSTGEVIRNLHGNYSTEGVYYIGVDSSEDMVKKSKQDFSDYSDVNIVLSDVLSEEFRINNASLITSILTFQFIPQRDRKSLAEKIYKGLNKGGGFIFVEKVVGNNARFDEMWVELYHEMKLRNGLTPDEVMAKSRAIRGVMRPNTVSENMGMLEDAGFTDVDMFFKWNNFVGLIASK